MDADDDLWRGTIYLKVDLVNDTALYVGDIEVYPEVVFFLDYRAGKDGWARSIMVHPDGYASAVRHRPDQMDKGVRWISRTPDQDCFGPCLPSTAEPDGYLAEKAKGNVRRLEGGRTARFDCEAGLLTPAEAREEEAAIARILAGGA